MEIKIYNTLTKKKDVFKPINENEVTMYSCGPTVYKDATIGNIRTAIMENTLENILKYNGYNVKHVMNITDVGHLVSDADEGEDKMEKSAKEENKSPQDIAKYYTNLYFEDFKKLNIKKPEIICPATDYIDKMIDFIQILLDRGYAYITPSAIFFDISKLVEKNQYPNLTNQAREEQIVGSRIEVDQNKKNPQDFALWIKAKKEHLQKWPSPWYEMGYPGWHIECSTMSTYHLGKHFDIHTGGIDLIPTHHENEIAQSLGANGEIPANFWVHGEFLLVDNTKMSKSLGNVYLVDDILKRRFNPLAYKYFLYQGHYKMKVNFTWDAISSSNIALNKIYQAYNQTKDIEISSDKQVIDDINSYEQGFLGAINDDMNMPLAMSYVWKVAKYPTKCKNIANTLLKFDNVLQLNIKDNELKDEKLNIESLDEEIKNIYLERKLARENKNWQESDRLRELLKQKGYNVIDTKDDSILEKI